MATTHDHTMECLEWGGYPLYYWCYGDEDDDTQAPLASAHTVGTGERKDY